MHQPTCPTFVALNRIMRSLRHAMVSLAALGGSLSGSLVGTLACGQEPTATSAWKLVWHDEFDQPGTPSDERWSYELGDLKKNNEQQFYTKRPENIRIDDGKLWITARSEAMEGKPYTSASLTTRDRKAFLYGRIEVRAKIPTGRGAWPAIWMLGTKVREHGWPRCGEIDIMENVGFDPDTMHCTIHCQAYNHMIGTQRGKQLTIERPYDDYHVYAVQWQKDQIRGYADGKEFFRFDDEGKGPDCWPFDQPHDLIINLAIGGDWGGQKGIDPSILPLTYSIDYVRVYQADPTSGKR
jgi:beta-glucanase (GH16 family)